MVLVMSIAASNESQQGLARSRRKRGRSLLQLISSMTVGI